LQEDLYRSEWKVDAAEIDIGWDDEADGLFLKAIGDKRSNIERPLTFGRCSLRVAMRIVQGADRCELRCSWSSEIFLACGVRFPINATHATAYLEICHAPDGSVMNRIQQIDGLNPDHWHEFSIDLDFGHASASIDNRFLGKATIEANPTTTLRISLAVQQGIGQFRSLEADRLQVEAQ
jgi:hypothetical protein